MNYIEQTEENELVCTQTASGWELYRGDDYLGFVLDSELAELELSQQGVWFHKFPFRGFGRLD